MTRLEQIRLAEEAKVAVDTVRRLEAQNGRLKATTTTIDSLQAALERAGVVFTNGDEPGVKMRVVAEASAS
jgi:hypothetical protein